MNAPQANCSTVIGNTKGPDVQIFASLIFTNESER